MYGNTEMEDWRNCTERDAFARKSLIGLSFRGQFAELFGRNPEGQLRSFSEATWGNPGKIAQILSIVMTFRAKRKYSTNERRLHLRLGIQHPALLARTRRLGVPQRPAGFAADRRLGLDRNGKGV